MDRIYDVAIAGGGFAGLMVAANLALRGEPAAGGRLPTIYWADAAGHGLGTAYSTKEAHHLLNVPAAKMSAWLGGGTDFHRWLEGHYPGVYAPGAYVPRMIFAQYLGAIRVKLAAALGDSLTFDHNMMTGAVQRGGVWHVTGVDGAAVQARHLVLATGNPALADLGWPDDARFIRDCWAWRLAGGHVAAETPHVVVAGTGLTAVDIILSLRADGYEGPITAVAPHGRWPQCHADPVAPYEGGRMMAAEMIKARGARTLLRILRTHIERADGNWRGVIGSIRDHTVMIWQTLPEAEKARFMRHLWGRWNVHRHRMAPEIHEKLTNDAALATARGYVAVGADGVVTIRGRDGTARGVPGAMAINCTGPNYRRMAAENPLLANLLAAGHVAAGPLGLGIATPDAPGLHAVGTVLLGERLETTAVPDLRQQAAAVAARIAATL